MPDKPLSPRQRRKAETRRLLRDTGQRLFGELGFEATSIGAITRAAGVAHGTFYVHFATKEVLLDELLAEFNGGLATHLAPLWAGAGGMPLAELVETTAGLFLDHWGEHRGFVEIYARRVATGLALEQLRDGLNPPAADLLTSALVQLASDQSLPEPELIAQGLLAAWLRIGMQHLFGEGVGRARATAALTHITLGALTPLKDRP
ncbi:MAG: TetR/AcrR family transcriptional regulator [Proteobacteria bacterium]|nr:TetR/AcrR family transcriptional regulator [Pseudomonadota bacterium]